jgi:hypothetical protein
VSRRAFGPCDLRVLTPSQVTERKSPRQLFKLLRDFSVVTPNHGRIVVPEGFVCDFASIPRFALWYTDDDDPAVLFPSIVHDYLYTVRGELDGRMLTRRDADEIFRESIVACGGRKAQAWVIYQAVRLGGGSHWGKS